MKTREDDRSASGDNRREGPRKDSPQTVTSGQLLRHYRRISGMTQEELAERSGYTANYIGKLERGGRQPPLAALQRMAEVLGLGDEARSELLAARAQRADASPGEGQITGRDAELAAIREHLAGLGPPVLLFAGEPGIGKTRLLEETAAYATRGGWWVVQGGCQRRAQDPYAPLSDALSSALEGLSTRDREAALDDADGLGLLLPELGMLRTGRDSGAASQPGQERRLLYASVARCLRTGAGAAGALLILDDLQWAGPDVFDLLTTLVSASGRAPIRLVAAYRDSETSADSPLAGFVADLARDSMVQVLPLGPLSQGDAEQLLARLIPDSDERRRSLVPAIVRRSGGVPFFLLSYLDDLRRRGGAEPGLELPWTVTQVIRQRVVALPERVQEVLGVAAVVGRTVRHPFLGRVMGHGAEEVLGALEAAAGVRLLTEDDDGAYCFVHDVIRETIEQDLSTGRRRMIHQRIGETLEHDRSAPLESLAFHFAQSDDESRAIRYLELAGDDAQRRFAHAAAADFFRRAIEHSRASQLQESTSTHERLGSALYLAGLYDEAVNVLEHAVEMSRAQGDEEGLDRVAGRLAEAHFRRGTGHELPDAATTVMERGALGRANGASQGAVTLGKGVAALLFGQGSFKRLLTVGRSFRRAGRITGNGRLQTLGTCVEASALIFLGRLAEGTAMLESTIPEDLMSSRDERLPEIGSILSVAYLHMGAVVRSRELSTKMLHLSESINDAVHIAVHTLLIGAARHIEGDGERAAEELGRAQVQFAANGPSALSVRMMPVLADCLIREGRWEEARGHLDATVHTARAMRALHPERTAISFLGLLDLREGRPRAAIARLTPLLMEDLGWAHAVILLSTLAEAYLELEDMGRAHPLAERAVAEARRMGDWLPGVEALRVLGMIEACRDDHDAAERAFDEGLGRARAMPFPYAEARLLHASGLLQRRRGNDVRAGEQLQEALSILHRLGAKDIVCARVTITEQ